MSPTRSLRFAAAVLVTLCASASAASQAPSTSSPARDAGDAPHLVRSSEWLAPVQVLVAAAPVASTTTTALPHVPSTLSHAGIPARALAAYRAAADSVAAGAAPCRLTWPLLAAIGFVESGHGSVHSGSVGTDGRVSPPILGPRLDGSGAFALIRDTDGGRLDGDPSLDRAVGPMQFIPSTWARHGADGDGTGTADPHDLDDAALAAARYLCHTSRHLDRPAGAIAAVFSYNHSYDYVRVVLTAAARYAGQSPQRWGVGLLPAASAPTTTASPSPLPEAPTAEQEGAGPQDAPTATPGASAGEQAPESGPSPNGEPEQEPTPDSAPPPPQDEPAPSPEPSAQSEPAPEEPTPTPAAAG